MSIGVLRGRENSFPDAFIGKVNSMGRGVFAEQIQLGGTKLNEPVPYRVVLDRMGHEVPYYSVYLKMAALQGTYAINNTFWRNADDKFFGYAIAEKLGHRRAEDGRPSEPPVRRGRQRGEPAQSLAHRLRRCTRTTWAFPAS